MAVYYVELSGGDIQPNASLSGGGISVANTLAGGDIYPGGSGGGGANLTTKSVSYTPTESAISDTLTPPTGYDGFSQVSVDVGAISSTYVGSGIAQRTSADMSESAAIVTAPSGYYANNASYTIPYASGISLSSTIVGADIDTVVSVGSAGYLPSGSQTITQQNVVTPRTSSDLSASGATVTAPSGYYASSATKTIPNASSPQLSGVGVNNDGSVDVDLDISSGGYIPATSTTLPAGYLNVQAAQTITPTTTNQTIPADYYLLGAQTILGDADLVAGNIKKDVNIFGVVGTYEGGGGGGGLPAGYEAYDYIALTLADGTSYQNQQYGILVPISMSTDYTFETKVMYNSASNSSAQPILGTRTGGSGTKEFGLFYTPSNGRCGYWINGTDSTNAGNWFVADAVNSVEFLPVGKDTTYPTNVALKVNGTSHSTGSSSTGITFSQWLGFFKYASSATGFYGNATYYGLKIGETKIKDGNGVLLHDLVPCLLGGTYPGFYDTVAEAFYMNAQYYTYFTVGNWSNPTPQQVLDILLGE